MRGKESREGGKKLKGKFCAEHSRTLHKATPMTERHAKEENDERDIVSININTLISWFV